MRVVPFNPTHLCSLVIQRAQEGGPALTDEQAKALAQAGACYSALDDAGKTVAVAGVTVLWEGRAIAWAMIDAAAGRHFIGIDRAVRAFLAGTELRRIEAHVDARFEAGIRWLEMLGFKREGFMAKFTPDSRDCFLYARVR